MKKLSLLMMCSLLVLAACSSGENVEYDSDGAVEMSVEVRSVEADLQEARDMWAEVIEQRDEQDFDLAVLRMKAVYAKANYHVFNGETSEGVTEFMGELDGLLEAAEAGEFGEDFFYSALTEGLGEYDAVLSEM